MNYHSKFINLYFNWFPDNYQIPKWHLDLENGKVTCLSAQITLQIYLIKKLLHGIKHGNM